MKVDKTAVWNVRFTLPKGDPAGHSSYTVNRIVVCVCDTIDDALALVRKEHPAATIYGIAHKGQETTLFDPKFAEAYVAAPTGSVDKP